MDILVLGPIAAAGEHGEVPLGGVRPRRLLGILTVAGGSVVSEDRIIDWLWTEDEKRPDDPLRTVRTNISRLRAVLGAEAIASAPGGYGLTRAVAVDADRAVALMRVAAIERSRGDLDAAALGLRECVALWRGDSLSGFAHEPWAHPEARRLDELRLDAREQLAACLIESGRAAEATADLVELVDASPLRENAWRHLMLGYFATGRQVDALRAFSHYRELLAEETGLEPSPELYDLERRIIARDPSLETNAPVRRIAGYELGERIGDGAFGSIYRAKQSSVGREVAIKVVRAELANDPDFVRRFESEAQTVARLEHPHIVPLYDFWRDPSGAYLVMRYFAAGSAAMRLVRDGPWSLADVARLAEEIGSALAIAHEAGVVHRDVKPGNILLDDAGNSYLADFGIATGTGTAAVDLRSAGSPLYAAPEQVRDGVSGTATDIYAFGILLYELLTGAAPHSDVDSLEALFQQKLRTQTPSMADVRTDVPTQLDAVIRTATAIEPTDRFPSAAEMVLAVRSAIGQAAGAITTADMPERPREQAGRTLVSIQLEGVNPYKGLAAFGEADAADFHGRDGLVGELVERTASSRFTLVAGPSGSGKSSVVRAGLVPRLRESGAFVATLTPGVNPLDELETALLRVATEPSAVLLVEQLSSDERGLARAVRSLLPDDGSELVLVVDQFEELFTLSSEEQRDRFIGAIVHAVTDERSRIRVVATLRADFYDRPLQHPLLSDLVRVNTVPVSPLSGPELEEAITAPAARVGVRVEPPLVAELVGDVGGHPAALPMLQFALTETFERRTNGVMALDQYAEIGGITGALANRADELYLDATPDQRESIRRLFTRLITPGEGTEDTRRRVLRSELAAIDGEVIDGYGSARLLTYDHDPGSREPTVEVAHEALIREWPRLRGWLDDDRDGLRTHRQLGSAAASWIASGRDPSELYRGGRLEHAVAWADEHGDDLNETEAEFLAAGEQQRLDEEAAKRRQVRRLRGALVGVAIVAALAGIAGAIALIQRSRANDQADLARSNEAAAVQAQTQADVAAAEALANADEAARQEALALDAAEQASASAAEAIASRTLAVNERMAADAAGLAGENIPLSLLLAVEVHNRDPGPVGLGALQQALTGAGSFLGLVDTGPISAVRWLDDERVVVASPERIQLVDLTDGTTTPLAEPGANEFVGGGVGDGTKQPVVSYFDTSSDLVAFVPSDQPTRIDIVSTTGMAMGSIEHVADVEAVALSGDGTALIAGLENGRLVVTDLATMTTRWESEPPAELTIADVAWPNGTVDSMYGEPINDVFGGFELSFVPVQLAVATDAPVVASIHGVVMRRWNVDTGEQIGATTPVMWLGPSGPTGFVLAGFPVLDPTGSRYVALTQRTTLITGPTDGSAIEPGRTIRTATSWYGTPHARGLDWDGSDQAYVRFSDGRAGLLELSTGDVTNEIISGLTDVDAMDVSPGRTRMAMASTDGLGVWSLDGDGLLARGLPRLGSTVASHLGGDTIALHYAYVRSDGWQESVWWDDSGEERVRLPTPTDELSPDWSVGFAFGGGTFGSVDIDFRPSLWDLETMTRTRMQTDGSWSGQAVSDDGRWGAFGTGENGAGVTVFDVATGEVVQELAEAGVDSMSFSPDGRLLAAVGREAALVIYETETWQQIETPVFDEGVRVLRFSPDGRFLVTVLDTGSIVLRDAADFSPTKTIISTQPSNAADSDTMYFDSTGRYLVSSAVNSGVLFDLELGVQIGAAFPNEPDFRIGGKDGFELLTAVGDHIKRWNLDFTTWPDIACQAAGRNLTLTEWEQFGPPGEEYRPTCPQWPTPETT